MELKELLSQLNTAVDTAESQREARNTAIHRRTDALLKLDADIAKAEKAFNDGVRTVDELRAALNDAISQATGLPADGRIR